MASPEAMNRKRTETLPADFNGWDDKEVPSTLPPDFREFDPSSESEDEAPVVVQPITTPASESRNSKTAANNVGAATLRESGKSQPISRPIAEKARDRRVEPEEQRKSHKGLIIGGIAATVVLGGAATFMLSKRTATKVPIAAAPVAAAAQSVAPPQPLPGAEKPAPGKLETPPAPAVSSVPQPAQPDAQDTVAAQDPPQAVIAPVGMQSGPSRIAANLKQSKQPDAPPPSGFSASGLTGMAGGNSGPMKLFSGNSKPQVQAALPSVVDVPGSQALAMVTRRTDPIYPPIAKSVGTAGTVQLEVSVGKDGSVQGVRVLGGPRLLEEAAADAVKRWKFRPYTINNQPVNMKTTVSIVFTLGR